MDEGLAGGIVGAVIGLMDAATGTYFGIRSTNGPRQRALAIWLMALVWLWMAAVVAWLFLMPRTLSQLAILWNLPLWLLIPWGNRRLARARAEDEADSGLPRNRSSAL